MMTSRLAFAVLLSLIGLLPVASAQAVGLSLVVTPSHTSAADAFYPGTGSSMTFATDKQTGVSFTVAGRQYGVDAAPGQARWGLRTGQNLTPHPGSTFIVTNGFTPAAAGSKTTSAGTAASYISITVGNAQPNTMFKNLSIDFNGLAFTRTTSAWAASSVGGFNQWVAATQTNEGASGRKLSVTLPDFTWAGGEPLEIRLYGLTGSDEGQFANIKITGEMLAPQIPEPATPLLSLALAASWLSRRRRK